MIVYLVRHTKVSQTEGLCYGQTDVPLAASYPQELKTLQKKLPKTFDACFSSPSARCTQLVQDLVGKNVAKTPALLELNFGDWEGQHWDDIDRAQIDTWAADFVKLAPPGGESYQQLNQRVLKFWKDLIAQPHKTVLVVTHAGVIRTILAHLQKTPLEDSMTNTLNYGSVTVVKV